MTDELPTHDPVLPLEDQEEEYREQIAAEPLPESPEPDPELD